jgi:pimeloyl-ACP methyl ester carboxylesterase
MFKTYTGTVIEQGMINLPLNLDIYQPENDHLDQRPLLLLIHGGAFFFGDKENRMQEALTNYMVRRGYIVASMNYRLGSTLLGKDAIERTIYRNVQDTRAALRYLVNYNDEFGIDTEQIYLVGSSAGGIIALTTAFMDSYEIYSSTGEGTLHLRENLRGLDDSGNDLKAEFNLAGVVSLWGGVTDLKILDNPVPTLLFHGTEDDIVPCDKGLPFKKYMGNVVHGLLASIRQLYGSELILNHLIASNIPAKYVPFHGSGHELYIDPDGTVNANMDIICDSIGNFLFDNVSKQYFNCNLSGNTNVKKHDSAPVYQLDNVRSASVKWQVDGGFITKQTNNTIRVIWYNSHKVGTVKVCVTNANGVSRKMELKVKIITDNFFNT